MSGQLNGPILVNGQQRNLDLFVRHTSYIERGDLYYPFLTVQECVRYRASLRLSPLLTNAFREEYTDAVRDPGPRFLGFRV